MGVGAELKHIERDANILFADAKKSSDPNDDGDYISILVDDNVVDLAEIVAIAALNRSTYEGLSSPGESVRCRYL